MKISIVTVVYNGEKYLEHCMQSVLAQDYPEVEYILIDGGSTDSTLSIIQKYRPQLAQVVSGPDKGIYDAMNKGIALATGEVIGFMNADDYFASDGVISAVAQAMQTQQTDAVIGNVTYIRPENPDKVVRYFSSKGWLPEHTRRGEMPPHLSFYAKKSVYDRLGYYKTDYKIAADFELIQRFLYVNRISYTRIPETAAVMRMGGVSSNGLASTLTINREIFRACRENGVKTSWLRIYSKYFRKVFQFFRKPVQGGQG